MGVKTFGGFDSPAACCCRAQDVRVSSAVETCFLCVVYPPSVSSVCVCVARAAVIRPPTFHPPDFDLRLDTT